MPTWKFKVDLSDVFHNDDLTFIDRRDAIVKRLRRGPWNTEKEDFYGDFDALLDELSETERIRDFDSVWEYVYDWADEHRLWITTRSTVAAS